MSKQENSPQPYLHTTQGKEPQHEEGIKVKLLQTAAVFNVENFLTTDKLSAFIDKLKHLNIDHIITTFDYIMVNGIDGKLDRFPTLPEIMKVYNNLPVQQSPIKSLPAPKVTDDNHGVRITIKHCTNCDRDMSIVTPPDEEPTVQHCCHCKSKMASLQFKSSYIYNKFYIKSQREVHKGRLRAFNPEGYKKYIEDEKREKTRTCELMARYEKGEKISSLLKDLNLGVKYNV